MFEDCFFMKDSKSVSLIRYFLCNGQSFISRRPVRLRHDLFEDAVGSALGIDAGAKLFISNLDYGVSNQDIKVVLAVDAIF